MRCGDWEQRLKYLQNWRFSNTAPKAGMMDDVETMTEEHESYENLRMEDTETHNQKYTSHASRDEVHTHLNRILLMQPTKCIVNAEKLVI